MSQYRYEIKVHNDPKFYPNAVVFATEAEATAAGADKFDRWTMAADVRTVPTEEPANYRYVGGDVSIEAL